MAAKNTKESQPKSGGKSKTSEPVQMEEAADSALLSKNPIRALMFKDIMLQEIVDGLKSEQVSKEDMEEVLFLTVANAVMERIGLNLPEELLFIFQENLDDYLAIASINNEHQVDLLSNFRDDFLTAQGDSFDDERALMEALTAYEDNWWNSAKDYLGGKVPNDLMNEAKEKLAGPAHDDQDDHCGCGCEESEDDAYWTARSYVIRDMWLTSMLESMAKEAMPTPQKRERIFMALTNALLDLVVNVMPDYMSDDMFEGLDHSLELALVNKESKIDVLEKFEAALAEFEGQWWQTGMKELGGKSPDEAMQAMARKYGL